MLRLKSSTDGPPPPVQALDSVRDSVMLVDTSIAEAARWTLQFANENWVRMTGEFGARVGATAGGVGAASLLSKGSRQNRGADDR